MNKKNNFQTTLKERISYPLFAVGQGMVYLFTAGYLMLYMTNHIYIAPATVGIILFVSKVWDAINDPLFGLIVDRVTFKRNKFKPWLRISTVFIPITTFLMFMIPKDASDTKKVVLAVVLYFIWDMAYTISDVPVYSLLTSMTSNVTERSTLISYGSIAGVFNAIILTVVLVPKIETWGFGKIAAVVSIIAFSGMLPLTITGKERVRESMDKQEKSTLKDIFVFLKNNKYLLYYFLFLIINGMFALGSLMNYVIIELLGSLKYLAIFVAIGAVPTAILYLFMPKITSRFDKMAVYRFGIIVGIVLNIAMYFTGYENIYIFGAVIILKTIILTSTGMLTFTFAMDCIEYGHYKTGLRREGITFSIQTFGNKFIAAISASLGAFILAFIGYDGTAEHAQTAATLTGLWNAYIWIPVIGSIIALPFLFLYKLKSKDVQIMADINTNKISREEGDALMSSKY